VAIVLLFFFCKCLSSTSIEGFTQQQQQTKLMNDSKHLNLLKMLWVLWSADSKGGPIDSLSVQKLNSYYQTCNTKTDIENGTGNICDKKLQMSNKDVNLVKLYEYLLNSKKIDYTQKLQNYIRLNGTTDIQNIIQSNHLLNTILWNSIPSKNTVNSSHKKKPIDFTIDESKALPTGQRNTPSVIVHNPTPKVHFNPPTRVLSQKKCSGTPRSSTENMTKLSHAYDKCMTFKSKNQDDLKYVTWDSDKKIASCFTESECSNKSTGTTFTTLGLNSVEQQNRSVQKASVM